MQNYFTAPQPMRDQSPLTRQITPPVLPAMPELAHQEMYSMRPTFPKSKVDHERPESRPPPTPASKTQNFGDIGDLGFERRNRKRMWEYDWTLLIPETHK